VRLYCVKNYDVAFMAFNRGLSHQLCSGFLWVDFGIRHWPSAEMIQELIRANSTIHFLGSILFQSVLFYGLERVYRLPLQIMSEQGVSLSVM